MDSPYAVSDTELFASLDYSLPALAPVKKAVDAGNIPGAKKALADYLRARTSVPWNVSPKVADRSTIRWDKNKAEDAVNAKVQVVTIWHTFPEGNVDWFYSATGGNTGLPANNEWQWQLNRMAWWGDLGYAYQATGDERYAKAWVSQLKDWSTDCAPPATAKNTVNSAWRTIECGIRMGGVWPASYQRFLLSPSFTDDDVATYLKTSIAHARYLSAYPSTGNWLTMEMSGLYAVGALFPELKDAKAWRDQAGAALYKELASQFLPDGAQVELTPGYHNVALDNVLKIYEMAKMVGREKELPGDYVARMERAFAFNLDLMTPNRDLPRFNDSWPYGVPRRFRDSATLFPNRPDFAWIGSDGKTGTPPKQTSLPMPYAGYYVMRSGWDTGANYAVLDAGPLGYGHVHQDKLNLVLWGWGRELLFDSGGGSYESSKYRSYATDTFGHNTVLVDNLPQRRQTRDREANVSKTPIDAGWKSTDTYDYVEGSYTDGYGKEDNRIATHTRRVLFVKPDLFVVSDVLKPADTTEHTYQARWNLLTTASEKAADGSVVTTDAGQPNLAVVPLFGNGLEVRNVSAQNEPEVLGWHVRKDMDPQYVPATTVLHTRRGAGEQRFLTLLLPLKAGQKNPVKTVEALSPTSAKITLTDGRTFTVSDTPGEGVRFTESGGSARRVAVK